MRKCIWRPPKSRQVNPHSWQVHIGAHLWWCVVIHNRKHFGWSGLLWWSHANATHNSRGKIVLFSMNILFFHIPVQCIFFGEREKINKLIFFHMVDFNFSLLQKLKSRENRILSLHKLTQNLLVFFFGWIGDSNSCSQLTHTHVVAGLFIQQQEGNPSSIFTKQSHVKKHYTFKEDNETVALNRWQ